MREEKAWFHSDGLKLDASFYHPDDGPEEGLPIVIVCSGFQGLNKIHPARFARALTRAGFFCFGFDYRGFARSEGAPGVTLLEEQARDISNAVSFARMAAAERGAGCRGLVLAGWGMGAGLILEAARLVVDIDGLISINGFYDAMRVQRALRGERGLAEFLAWYREEKSREARSGERRKHDPFRIYPLDPETAGYVDGVLRKNPDFGIDVHLCFADSLVAFHPEADLRHLASVPILIAHGDRNRLHPVEEARSLFGKYPGPKELYWVEDAGHTEWMHDDNPRFQRLARKMEQWIRALR